jgi:hypothetical protein
MMLKNKQQILRTISAVPDRNVEDEGFNSTLSNLKVLNSDIAFVWFLEYSSSL